MDRKGDFSSHQSTLNDVIKRFSKFESKSTNYV